MSVKVEWPTGKEHTSYSEIATWHDCSFRHKKIYVDNIGEFSVTPHLGFGTSLHAASENFLITRDLDKSLAVKLINEDWEKNGEFYKTGPFPDWASDGFGVKDDWIKRANIILEGLPQFMDRQFPGWKCFKAEEFLYEPIEGQPIKFKGFIDAIIEVEVKGKRLYWIIDWKTCGWGWPSSKKKDFKVQLQLILYKHYWAKKHNIPLSQIRCGFALMKRDAKDSAKAISIVPVSVGPKTIGKGLKVINNHCASVKKGFVLKNRNSCKFCEFENTIHCPPSF